MLALPGLRAARAAEAGEGVGRRDEGVVRVEAPGRARAVVAVQQHLVEQRLGEDGRDATAAAAGDRRAAAAAAAGALALAAVAAVVGGGAAPAPFAAAEAVGALRAAGLRPTLLGACGPGQGCGHHGHYR